MTALLAKYHGDASFPSGDAALVALFALFIYYIGSNTNDDNEDDTGSSRYYYKGIAARVSSCYPQADGCTSWHITCWILCYRSECIILQRFWDLASIKCNGGIRSSRIVSILVTKNGRRRRKRRKINRQGQRQILRRKKSRNVCNRSSRRWSKN